MPRTRTARVPQSAHHDRAFGVTTTIIGIVTDALRQWLRGDPADLAGVHRQIEKLLRDEFDDVKREAAGERIAGFD